MYVSASIFSLLEFHSPTLTSLSIALTNFVCTLLGLVIIDNRRPSPHPASLDPRNDPGPHSLFSRLRMKKSLIEGECGLLCVVEQRLEMGI